MFAISLSATIADTWHHVKVKNAMEAHTVKSVDLPSTAVYATRAIVPNAIPRNLGAMDVALISAKNAELLLVAKLVMKLGAVSAGTPLSVMDASAGTA